MNALMKNKYFFSLLILVILNSLIKSVQIEEGEFLIYEKGEFILQKNSFKSNYVSYKVEGDPDVKYVLSAYSDKDKQKRIQLGQSIQGKINLYIANIKSDIYFDLECFEYSNCTGNIFHTFNEKITLSDGEPINYFVNQDNEEIQFLITSLNTDIFNIWARGQFQIKTTLSEKALAQNTLENYGDFYIVNKPTSDSITLTVIAKKGDYINVGFIQYKKNNNDYDSMVNITINGPILTGFLKRDYLEKICYKYERDKEAMIISNGAIFTKIGYSYFADIEGYNIQSKQLFTSGLIRNGIIYPNTIGNNGKLCIKFPEEEYNEIDEIIYVYNLQDGKENDLILNEPQINGVFYPKSLGINSKAVFISQKNSNFEKMSLNLMTSAGYPKMYVLDCKTYPICNFDDNELQNNSIRPRNINRFSSYNFLKKDDFDISPISKKQTIFLVECQKIEDENGDKSTYLQNVCDFNSLIYKDDDNILLLEEKFFNQYAVAKQKHNYKINVAKESNIKKIFIDIMTYVGDVEVNTDKFKEENVDSDKYIAINKIFISAKLNNKKSEDINELSFSVSALSNTYYTILVNFAKEENAKNEDSFITNKLETGMSYLVTIDTSKSDEYRANKIIKYYNEKTYEKNPYIVNFYSLNCDIESFNVVNFNEKKYCEKFDHFSHDVIYSNDDRYDSNIYDYRISVKSPDTSDFDRNLCKIYTSAVELSKAHDDYTRDILISDNTPQQFMFNYKNEVRHVSYGYVHVDFKNDLLVKFNLKHTAKYRIQFYFENHVREKKEEIIVSNNMLYLNSKDWSDVCKDSNRACYIQLDITLDEIKDNDISVLELSIKSISTQTVDYIPKNNLKFDYVQNSMSQLFYTEIGKDESGFVIVNFLRGSGKVLGRIVPIYIDKPEEDANWRGKYKLPDEDELVKMEPYTKKLKFFTMDECQQGCYLLLKVISDVIAENVQTKRNYPYSIIVHTYPNIAYSQDEIPIIRIPLDEYIIGSINYIGEKEFYSVLINSEAEEVFIDLQSEAGILLINVGEERPNYELDQYDFKFGPNSKDILNIIKKNQILEIYDKKNKNSKLKSIKGLVLTMEILAEMTDSIFTTPFSFAIRLEDDEENEIYRVKSDQKVLCNPKIMDNKALYRCLYVIDYEFILPQTDLFLYPIIQDKSATFNIYAKFIDATIYEMGTKEEINPFIPSSTNKEYPQNEEKTDYLYINTGTKIDRYLLVSIEISKEAIVELVTTIYLYQEEITPNSYSPQLFNGRRNQEITLNFPKDYKSMVNIICVGGRGVFFWESDTNHKYTLKGREDRLSITTTKSFQNHKLKINSDGQLGNLTGVLFIVEYNIINDVSNFDPLVLDKSVNYVYLDNDFPINYYTPLNTFESSDSYYEIFFTFNDLQNEEVKELTYYENIPFVVKATIVEQESIYNAKLYPEISYEGNVVNIFSYYDQAMRSGLIRISKKYIEDSQIQSYEKPFLCLKFDKSEAFKNVRKYKRISVETTLLYSKSDVPLSEISNQFGFLNKEENQKEYTIRTDDSFKNLILEFSCIDDNLILEIQNSQKELKKFSEKYGKIIYSLETNQKEEKLKLIIKRKKSDNEPQYFYFRYFFSNDVTNRYEIKDTRLDVTETKKIKLRSTLYDFDIKLTPFNAGNSNNIDLTYMVKLVTSLSFPEKSNIVMKPALQNVKEFYNPQHSKDLLLFHISDITNKISYIQIILQIKEGETVEYLSYDIQNKFTVIEQNKEEKKKGNSNDNKPKIMAFIIIGSILFIIAVVLVLIVMVYNQKNKHLLDQVNQVSFAESLAKEVKEDDDLLLNENDIIN